MSSCVWGLRIWWTIAGVSSFKALCAVVWNLLVRDRRGNFRSINLGTANATSLLDADPCLSLCGISLSPHLMAMATLTETDLTRVSTEAGEHFVDHYYTALNGSRNTINGFYVPTVTSATGRGLPSISYNGELVQDAGMLQERYEKDMPWTHFEPQSVNVHVMNPSLTADAKTKRDAERNLSLVVQVSGYVRIAERKDGPMRGFSDSFVLVPNKEEVGGRGTGKQDHGKRFLIRSQTFRFVV